MYKDQKARREGIILARTDLRDTQVPLSMPLMGYDNKQTSTGQKPWFEEGLVVRGSGSQGMSKAPG
jgi:hypothetical protein